MNWYFEQDGTSQGPLSEDALAAKVRAKELPADSLIWHVGLDEWKSVSELRPAWLQAPATPAKPIVAPVAKAAKQPAPAEAKTEKPGLLKRLFGFGK